VCDDAAMCGRFTQQRPTAELAELFEAVPAPSAVEAPDAGEAHYNVAPTQQVRVIVEPEAEAPRRVEEYRWGLIPSWAKSAKVGNRMINARAETVATSGAFKRSFANRRCIIPADAFYEWRRPEGGPNQPYLIRRRDGKPLAFAGLWATWHDDEHDLWLRSCTIITTGANALLGQIHDRMPVVLAPDDWGRWLDPEGHATAELQGLLVPSPAADLEAYPVSTAVNSPRNKGPELVRPVEGEPLVPTD
jgi:putative SOS response-associated peptidase YedK